MSIIGAAGMIRKREEEEKLKKRIIGAAGMVRKREEEEKEKMLTMARRIREKGGVG